MNLRPFINQLIVVSLAFLMFGCGSGSDSLKLLGGGATFPYPFYSKAFSEYSKKHDVRINYQDIGSGGGIRQLTSKTLDFGASDAFMNEDEIKEAGADIIHVPTCMGAVVLAYNLEGVDDLKLDSEAIAGIALGDINKWNHDLIKELNPDANLPDKEITFVHRSDGSGTTFIFSDYLYKTSEEWKEEVGRGKSISWPTGIGGKGNSGVAGYIKQGEGRIGYIEISYAIQNDMQKAMVKNQSGNFIKPDLEATTSAGNVDEIPDDTRITLTNTKAENGYSLTSFTWILLYKDLNYKGNSKEKAKAIVDLVNWMIHEGQQYAKPLHYAPLPDNVVKKAEKNLRKVTYNGEPLLEAEQN